MTVDHPARGAPSRGWAIALVVVAVAALAGQGATASGPLRASRRYLIRSPHPERVMQRAARGRARADLV